MANLVLSGDTSGQVTLTVPSAAGTNTVTVAAQTGTLNAAGPAFRVYRTANQTGITSGVLTKVQFNVEDFDTNNNYDPTTNFRFTPTVAGYYQLNASVYFTGTGLNSGYITINKNGSSGYITAGNFASTAIGNIQSTASCVVYMNGSTDYAEVYANGNVTSGTITLTADASGANINFSGCLMRGA